MVAFIYGVVFFLSLSHKVAFEQRPEEVGDGDL